MTTILENHKKWKHTLEELDSTTQEDNNIVSDRDSFVYSKYYGTAELQNITILSKDKTNDLIS